MCSHQALDVSEENSFFSNIQEHLLTPQLFVLSQEGEPCLGFLHTLHVPILEGEGQEVLQRETKREGINISPEERSTELKCNRDDLR